jgi:hypothetical protein
LQDDWEFELPIDLDHVSYVMNKNHHINCITFNKKTNIEYFKNESQNQNIDGLDLMENDHFPFLPGI